MTPVSEADKRPLNGKECSIRMGYNPQWVYQRKARMKGLPAHHEREKRERYAFPEECILAFEAAPKVSQSEVYNDPERLAPWDGVVGIFRDLPSTADVDRSLDHKHFVEHVLQELTPRERIVITHRFGLSGEREETLDEVGLRIGLSKERARQIEMKALCKMRAPSIEAWRRLVPVEKHPTWGAELRRWKRKRALEREEKRNREAEKRKRRRALEPWLLRGFRDWQVEAWEGAGFGPQEALAWRRLGHSSHSAKAQKAAGNAPHPWTPWTAY